MNIICLLCNAGRTYEKKEKNFSRTIANYTTRMVIISTKVLVAYIAMLYVQNKRLHTNECVHKNRTFIFYFAAADARSYISDFWHRLNLLQGSCAFHTINIFVGCGLFFFSDFQRVDRRFKSI